MDFRWPRIPRRVIDGATVAVVAAVGVLGHAVSAGMGASPQGTLRVIAVVLALGQAGLLWWRREHPLPVLVGALVALVAAQAVGDLNAASFLGPHVAAYTVGAHGRDRARLLSLPVMVLAALLDGAAIRWIDHGPAGAVLLGPGGVLLLIAWGVGRYVGLRRNYVSTLLAHNRQLELERDEQARQAVLDERRRIARELHDQVAHHLGVVSLQTSAARRWMQRDTTVAVDALEAAEAAARDALITMPVILDALRADTDLEAGIGPQPSLADLDALVQQFTGPERAIDVRMEGEIRRLEPEAELAAYRVIQEALTNAMKHADPTGVEVTLSYGPSQLRITVRNDGRGAPTIDLPPGHGLIGMRERVELFGGHLLTGPLSGGGFEVRALLPLTRRQAERR